MKRKIVSIVLVGAMGAVLLAGCGNTGNTDNTGNTEETVQTEVSSAPEETESEVSSAPAENGNDASGAESGDSDKVITGFDWMAEEEPDSMGYKEYEEKLGEITAEMVPEDFSIGVVSMASSNDYWQDVNAGIQERCDELGIEVAIQYCNGPADFEGQLTAAETLHNAGYSAYIFSPEGDANLVEITKKITDEGYPVINAYCCELADATMYIGSIDSQTAIESAKKAIEIVGNDGTVAVAEGDVATKLAQTRSYYFMDYLKKNSNITVEEIPAQWDPTTARTMTTDLLTANPDVSYIWCNNDDLALGVYEGLREANATDKCTVVGTDGTSAGLNSVKSGEVYGTFWNNPVLIGKLSVDACVRAAIGQDIPRVVMVDAEFVTIDSVDDYIK